ncbi:MAG TPA: hypothetical protein VGM25_04715 [Caulobacteraceae bacterium]|jgi:hypothetical protein
MQFFRHRQRDLDDMPDTAPDAAPSAAPSPRRSLRDPRLTPANRSPEAREAFAAGRRLGHSEARARRRRHPMLGLLVAIVAVAGAAMLVLAAREGSFARGGQLVDQNLQVAAGQAQTAGADALARTGEAIRDAGASLEQKTSATR